MEINLNCKLQFATENLENIKINNREIEKKNILMKIAFRGKF